MVPSIKIVKMPCNWDLKLKAAKGTEKTCLLSTATCFNHKNNTSSDLIR